MSTPATPTCNAEKIIHWFVDQPPMKDGMDAVHCVCGETTIQLVGDAVQARRHAGEGQAQPIHPDSPEQLMFLPKGETNDEEAFDLTQYLA